MLRVVNQIRTKSFNSIHYIHIHSYNSTIHQQCVKSFSTSKLADQLLDDSEELDPELIESFPPQPSTEETEEITPEQFELLQQQYAQEQMEQQRINGEDKSEAETSIPRPPPIRSQLKHKLTPEEIQDRQRKVWHSISNTLQGIWTNMDSIDKTNIKRIDRVYKKLSKLEILHVKNMQHSLHHIAQLRDEISTVNSRINHVFERLSDLEKTAASEWLEWSIPKYEIPYEDGIYLRSPGYEIGSMIWCIELRWEMDDNIQIVNKEHDADIENESNPIIDMNESKNDDTIDEGNINEMDGGEYERVNKGYNRLGVYVSPRSVAHWDRLSSLKATCEIRINENDYSDAISVVRGESDNCKTMTPPDKVNKKQQHFSVSGEFLRGKKLTSWGRTIPSGDDFFDKHKIDDEICIKLRIVNQTLSYQQYADDNKDEIVSGMISSEKDTQTDITDMETTKIEFENFDFKDKKSQIHKQQQEDEINDKIQHYMTIPINEFWNIFSQQVESAKSKQGYAIAVIAKKCNLDVRLVSIFRKGPMIVIDEDAKMDQTDQNTNSEQRRRRRKKIINRKLVQNRKWDTIVEYDANNPEFRRKLANFLVKHEYKKQKNLQSKASF